MVFTQFSNRSTYNTSSTPSQPPPRPTSSFTTTPTNTPIPPPKLCTTIHGATSSQYLNHQTSVVSSISMLMESLAQIFLLTPPLGPLTTNSVNWDSNLTTKTLILQDIVKLVLTGYILKQDINSKRTYKTINPTRYSHHRRAQYTFTAHGNRGVA